MRARSRRPVPTAVPGLAGGALAELRCTWGAEATRVLDLLHATATGVHTVAHGTRPFTLFLMPDGPDVVFPAHLTAAFFTEDDGETSAARHIVDALPADS